MRIVFIAIAIVLTLCGSSCADTSAQYESNITFYGWNSQFPSQRFVSNFTSNVTVQGCDPNGLFAVVVHGWNENINTSWVGVTVSRLLRYRGGCVFFMDYSRYAKVTDYFQLTPHFNGISAVLLKKVKQIGNYDRQYFFGFSFGSRLCIDAGLKLGKGLLGRMDLCDSAAPGFDNNVDPKPAAVNVACINTSTDKGTSIYNCHQNFRMGNCGYTQLAAGSPPLGNHGLCPYFYNLAFTNDFVPNNFHACSSARMLRNATSQVKMGYMSNFPRSSYIGDIFIATAKYPPYVVVNNVTDNQSQNLMKEFVTCTP